MLSALWAHWSVAPAPAPSSAVLVLDSAAADDLARPLASAMAMAEASVRRMDALLPAGLRDGTAAIAPAGAPATHLRTADYGLDTSGGAAHPLRVLAALNLLARKPVMAEGLIRAALARLEADVQWRGAGGAALPWPAPAGAARYAHFPPLLSAAVGAALHTFGDLLAQWERREEEGGRTRADAALLLGNAAMHLQPSSGEAAASPLAAVSDARTRFMAGSLVGAAAAATHIGSAGFALDEACEELVAAQ